MFPWWEDFWKKFGEHLKKMAEERWKTNKGCGNSDCEDNNKYLFLDETSELMKSLTDKIREFDARIEAKLDITTQFAEKIQGKTSLFLLEVAIALAQNLIAQIAHQHELSEEGLQNLKNYIKHLMFLSDDENLKDAFARCILRLEDCPDHRGIQNVLRFLTFLRDELIGKPEETLEFPRVLDEIEKISEIYLDPWSLARVKNQIEFEVNRLVGRSRPILKTESDFKHFLLPVFSFLAKLKNVKSSGEVHQLISQYRGDILRLYFLLQSASQPTAETVKKPEIELSNDEKILKILFDRKANQETQNYVKTSEIIRLMPISEVSVRLNLKKLFQRKLVEKVATGSREIAYRLTYEGERLIKELLGLK